MKKIFKILGVFTLLIMAFGFKDFHSSMTKVDYNSANGVLKFTTRMTTKDVQNVLDADPASSAFINKAKNYVGRNIRVDINGTPIRLVFTGGQVNGGITWVYYEASGVGEISSLKIKNSILLSEFPSQTNIVNIKYKGIQKTMTFQRGSETKTVNF